MRKPKLKLSRDTVPATSASSSSVIALQRSIAIAVRTGGETARPEHARGGAEAGIPAVGEGGGEAEGDDEEPGDAAEQHRAPAPGRPRPGFEP